MLLQCMEKIKISTVKLYFCLVIFKILIKNINTKTKRMYMQSIILYIIELTLVGFVFKHVYCSK